MKFLKSLYCIRGAYAKGFAYAVSCGPFESFDSFESIDPLVRDRMRRIWLEDRIPPGIKIDDYGSKWPDLLPCESPPPSEFLSRKVIDSLASNGIHPQLAERVPLGLILSQRLQQVEAPEYFCVEAETGIHIDYFSSNIDLDPEGDPLLPIGEEIAVHFDSSTWTGADLFRCANWPRGGKNLLCTERVKAIALKEGWSNVEFVRQRIKGIDPFTGQPV